MKEIIWKKMPRQDIEKKYPPRAKGISDGLNNEPPSDATEYTNTENIDLRVLIM